MFSNTLTLAGAVFTKVSEDAQSGTVYLKAGSTRAFPSTITIKHDVPKLGKVGIARHLLQISEPILDADGIPTKDRVTVNVTYAIPQVLGGEFQITACTTILAAAVMNAAALTTSKTVNDILADTSSPLLLLSSGHY